MKKTIVNYRNFSLTNINKPQYSHLIYLLGWPIYLVLFLLTEMLIPAENCYRIHCRLDDLIPFCEYFLIPYLIWYFLIIFTLIYYLVYNTEGFKRLQIYFITVQIIAIVCFILLPTRQELRPMVFSRENILTDGVRLLYSIDTNTGVCPSMHVAFSIAIVSVWTKDDSAHWNTKLLITITAVVICLSTLFLKQHSVLDLLAALPVCLFAEWVAYGGYYKSKYKFSID